MKLSELNQLTNADAIAQFRQCCTAERWCESMATKRPFSTLAELKASADRCWATMTEKDWMQAFEGHPKIGDVSSLKAKYANTKALASGEQSGAAVANEETLLALKQGNDDYVEKFGFIFIVCATGKSAEEMLALLQARLPNDRETELRNAAEEQRKILQIRIDKLITLDDLGAQAS